MHNLTVGFFDEKQLLYDFVSSSFRQLPHFKILFKANREDLLVLELKAAVPDILLMNLLPKRNYNIDLVRKIKNDFPDLNIAAFIYGVELSQQEVFYIINAGASAIFTDEHSIEEIIIGAEAVTKKGFHLNQVVNEAMFSYCKKKRSLRKSFGPEEKFCEREIKIIEAKRTGKTSVEVACELFVSKKTVDGILQDMYYRFDCHNFYGLLEKYECRAAPVS